MGGAREIQPKKQGLIYFEDAHRPFDHVCTPKQKSGATCRHRSHDQQHQCFNKRFNCNANVSTNVSTAT